MASCFYVFANGSIIGRIFYTISLCIRSSELRHDPVLFVLEQVNTELEENVAKAYFSAIEADKKKASAGRVARA